MAKKIRVLLADDHEIVRLGIRTLLEREADIEVVAEAKDGRDAVAFSRDLRPDIVLMDITMPGLNGIEATRQIVDELPNVRILALTIHTQTRFVRDMFSAGASGYVVKAGLFDDLVTAIHAVREGKTYVSTELGERVVSDYLECAQPTGATAPRLTGREREVLQLIAEGQSTLKIARLLSISPKSVVAYRQRICDKLNVQSVVDLVRYAIREGLTSIDL